jgi:hypothetical protein
MKPIRVRVTVTVELQDPQQWYDTYGKGSTPAQIRQEVKEHIGNGVAHIAPFGSDEVDAEIDWH